MNLRTAPKTPKKGKNIFLTFLLLLSIPIFVLGVLQNESFDIREDAFNDVEVSPLNPCVITFPNVNPYSLEVGKTFRIQIDAMSTSLGIQSISVTDSNNNALFTKTYTDIPKQTSESFSFTPEVAKAYEIKGAMADINKKTYQCIISSTYDVDGVRAVTNNSKPVFASLPKESKPSQNINTGDTYEYTLTAQDLDQDTINYSFSFTPNNQWLKPTVIEDGGNGKLTIKFRGSTNKAASYLANMFIHDGYSTHLSSQSWVINVNPKENDIPIVKIVEPTDSVVIDDETSFTVSWDATDDNQIVRYEVYMSSNPANQNSWITVNKNVQYNETTQSIDTREYKDGTYKIIVRAVDNQKPEAIGLDVSKEIVISRGQTEGKEPDDQVSLDVPQIINFSPTATDEIKNSKPTIKASLVATSDSKVDEESISIKLDNKGITEKIKINKISDSEYTVIYLPETDIETGIHKVEISFKDSNGQEAKKDWTFTIAGEEENTDNFNIFGYYINKRIAYIIAGGIGLIVLAIIVPIIIFAVWKDEKKEETPVPPTPTIPKTSNIIETPEIVTEPIQPVQQVPQQQTYTAPEPSEDIAQLLGQIEEIKKEDNTPPEPIL